MDTPAHSREARPAPERRPSPSPSPRPPRRRGLGGLFVAVAVLAALGWLTYRNATTSRALTEAIDSEARGDYPAALRAATEHLDRRPWSREAARIAARCLSRLDFAEKAEPYYAAAGGSLTVDDLRYRAYGLARVNLRERAIRAFDDVLARQGDDVGSLRLKVGLLMANSLWGEVAEVGRRLASFPPRPATFEAPVPVGGHWTFRPREVASVPALGSSLEATAYHNQGETEASVAATERVLALDPGLASIPLERRLFWALFAEDLLAVGRADDAIRFLTREDPNQSDPVLVSLKARSLALLGSVDESEACWRRVLQLAPDDPPALRNLGRLASNRGDHREAARLLSRAAELSPESVDAAYNLGLAYRRLGNEGEARRWADRANHLRLAAEQKARGPQPPPPTKSPAS